MTEIVLAVGASHSTLMNTHWEETFHKDRAPNGSVTRCARHATNSRRHAPTR
ncbi:hypothetical protein GCM10009574_084690 [Streptomyces asiaticus]|uniref:Uncharacterized protein n=2 Tax=Streptomyces rhizosphaericus TaxID=114699 RepID=A0ABN1QXR4_9ACTN